MNPDKICYEPPLTAIRKIKMLSLNRILSLILISIKIEHKKQRVMQSSFSKIADQWQAMKGNLTRFEAQPLSAQAAEAILAYRTNPMLSQTFDLFPLRLGIRLTSETFEKLWKFASSAEAEEQKNFFKFDEHPTYTITSDLRQNNRLHPLLQEIHSQIHADFKECAKAIFGRDPIYLKTDLQAGRYVKMRVPHIHTDASNNGIGAIARLGDELPTLVIAKDILAEASPTHIALLKAARQNSATPDMIRELIDLKLLKPLAGSGEFGFFMDSRFKDEAWVGGTEHCSSPLPLDKPLGVISAFIRCQMA